MIVNGINMIGGRTPTLEEVRAKFRALETPKPARIIPCQHPRTFHTLDGEGGGWCVLCGKTLAQIRGYDPRNYRGPRA